MTIVISNSKYGPFISVNLVVHELVSQCTRVRNGGGELMNCVAVRPWGEGAAKSKILPSFRVTLNLSIFFSFGNVGEAPHVPPTTRDKTQHTSIGHA